MHALVKVYSTKFANISGNTPLERVQNYLVCDQSIAVAAIEGIDRILTRADLPTIDKILASALRNEFYLLIPGVLLAAQRAYERNPAVLQEWPDDLAQLIYCGRLTYGGPEVPEWYIGLTQDAFS
jgi:hypothetical protein